MGRHTLQAIASSAPWAALLLAATACGGQSKFLEDEDWSREEGPSGGAWRDVEALSSDTSGQPTMARHLDGVRLGLTMGPNAPPTAHCACLDVAVGAPNDAVFRWDGEVPDYSPAQMAVAIRGEGARCPDGSTLPAGRRPSIRAVDRVGGDVVVVVEELVPGRPLALGALTTMPDPGGSLYVRPATRGLPYGVPVGSRELCKVYTRSGTSTLSNR